MKMIFNWYLEFNQVLFRWALTFVVASDVRIDYSSGKTFRNYNKNSHAYLMKESIVVKWLALSLHMSWLAGAFHCTVGMFSLHGLLPTFQRDTRHINWWS